MTEESFEEQTARLKARMVMAHFPELALEYLSGTTHDYREVCETRLARMVLGRAITATGDVEYDSFGRISAIGGQKVEGYTAGLMPVSVGGREIRYSLFGTPIGFE